ncbi:MAG TPA: hypothetical protein VHD57_00955 [Vicinamibacterales bacterium]|nr:hypothetical protein [Vicinamibacterales bacterium]
MQRGVVGAFVIGVALCAAAAAPVVARQQTTADLLAAAGHYLDGFAQGVDGLVIAEDYVQQSHLQVVMARHLKSDLTVTNDPALGLVEFRDVFDVDGKPVRDRENRVIDLFTHPNPNAMAQAQRIVAEGARFNLESTAVQRTLNLPMAALAFLRTSNQSRSVFDNKGSDSVHGRHATVLRFREKARPRLIGSKDEAAANGLFWIDPETGTLLQSELDLDTHIATTGVKASIVVTYRDVPAIGFWLPEEMTETYTISNGQGAPMDAPRVVATGGGAEQGPVLGTLSGHASYSDFRKFQISTEQGPAAAVPSQHP